MSISLAKTLAAVLGALLLGGCAAKTEPQASASKLPWSRVSDVQVSSDYTPASRPADEATGPAPPGNIGPGSSQSQVVLAWGLPDHILDSREDPKRKIWQYSHTIVVFQGTKAEHVLPR